jgi:hypothetical protein
MTFSTSAFALLQQIKKLFGTLSCPLLTNAGQACSLRACHFQPCRSTWRIGVGRGLSVSTLLLLWKAKDAQQQASAFDLDKKRP